MARRPSFVLEQSAKRRWSQEITMPPGVRVNGIHDMGGMHGFGPVVRERDEPVFHAEWERRTLALRLAMGRRRTFNSHEFRRTIERIPPHQYLGATYYEIWLLALENLLIEKGVVSRTEIDVVMAAVRAGASPPHAPVGAPDDAGSPPARDEEDSAALSKALDDGARSLRYDQSYRPRFKAGDRVTARNLNPEGHTRLPRYVRGHYGVIHRDWGVFVFPDTHAHGLGTKPQHCYAVAFDASELWGGDHPAGERVYVDLMEDYLDAHAEAAVDTKPLTNGSPKATAKSPAKMRAAKPARGRVAKKVGPGAHDARPPSNKE
jgi:nitrile hydratase subunit beta